MTSNTGAPYDGFKGRVSEFASDSEPWWPLQKQADPCAPNVVVVLVDDLGFSDLGAFGSEIPTPNIDALADSGWLFTNYRTAPLCSPARAALLTGLNPHRAGFGFVAHSDPGYPGFTGELPQDAPTLAESLRAGGYATFMVGKWHLTNESRLHDGADKSSWPLQRGFDRYFGSMDGFTSLHHPHRLLRDNSPVATMSFPEGYFLTDELTNEAISMIEELRVNDSEKPFFLYFAHTAVHGPLQAKPEDIAVHNGRYSAGWNKLREDRLSRQKELGVVSPDTELPPDELANGDLIPQWDSLQPEDRDLFARHMEVYAAAVTEIDQSVGRIVDRLKSLGEFENTIVIVTSDNGGTAEGGMRGTRSYFAQFGHSARLPADWIRDVPRDIEAIGGPRVHGHYPAGWARVSNTPFRSFKQNVYEGGVHAPLAISWPNSPLALKGIREQFVYVSDIAPTILELTGTEPLSYVNGRKSQSPDGRSVTHVLADPTAEGRGQQYFECVGRRSLIEGEWKIISSELPAKTEGASGGTWELYNLREDPTEMTDLSSVESDRVEQMAERWVEQAWRNGVFPLNDDGSLHTNRPSSERSLSDPVTIAPFLPPLERFRSSRLTVLRSFTIEADINIEDSAAGVIVAHGDQGGGYCLAIHQGSPLISYNAYGTMHRSSGRALPAGTHRLILRFEEQEDLRWRVRLDVNGSVDAELKAVPMLLGMAPFTGISVGYDYGGPVDWELHEEYGAYRFVDGEILRVHYRPGRRSKFDRTVIREIDDAVIELSD